jgi:hypothetical protein
MRSFLAVAFAVVVSTLLPRPSLALEPAATVPSEPAKGLTHWSAASTTAWGILGDVDVGADRLVIDDEHSYRLIKTRDLDERGLKATRKLVGEKTLNNAILYKIDIPGTIKFRGGNELCDATRVIIATGSSAVKGDYLWLIFFDGAREPYFEGWERTAGGLCGTFGYTRY